MLRSDIEAALSRLAERLVRRGVVGEVLLLRGAAMALAYDARGMTRDVDAVFEPRAVIRAELAEVATELGLAPDWLNDAAKGFLSSVPTGPRLAVMDLPGLRVWAPPPEYVFAMKCLAARREDRADIETLARMLGITSYAAAMAVVVRLYPAERLPPKTQFTLEMLFGPAEG